MSAPADWKKILGTLAVVTRVLLELLDAHANGGDTAEVAHTWRDTVKAHNADALAELAPRPDGD